MSKVQSPKSGAGKCYLREIWVEGQSAELGTMKRRERRAPGNSENEALDFWGASSTTAAFRGFDAAASRDGSRSVEKVRKANFEVDSGCPTRGERMGAA